MGDNSDVVNYLHINCKYCDELMYQPIIEFVTCSSCKASVHVKCLRKGSTPGGLTGDVFFAYTCEDCSPCKTENFIREKMPWLQAIVLVLHHMQVRTPGLARKGFFHWKIHIATFINKHWDVLFSKDFKRKKKWTGTISGTLSHYSPLIFSSGTSLFNGQGWWTLTYPKLLPKVIIDLNSELLLRKHKDSRMLSHSDSDMFEEIAIAKGVSVELLKKVSIENLNLVKSNICTEETEEPGLSVINEKNNKKGYSFSTLDEIDHTPPKKQLKTDKNKCENDTYLEKDNRNEFSEPVEAETSVKKPNRNVRKAHLLPTLDKLSEGPSNKLFKIDRKDDTNAYLIKDNDTHGKTRDLEKPVQFLNPFCHYNTSLSNLSPLMNIKLSIKLTGGIREELILSPYSGLYLKPYIRRETSCFPDWLKLMAEILLKTNKTNQNYVLPPRGPIDYTYVQPNQIPAINSLCNQYFWPGIDLTECLQYPEFSCVVMYKKLIVGFAFMVPDVKINENYLSFIFTRPGWRNCGIAKFMMYHLTQISLGKDITLHVSMNNPALLLYQKFGFKVENVVLNFYDKYLRRDTNESKHAFFCRQDR